MRYKSFKDAKYPSSEVRVEIMREILEPETEQFGLDYSNHKAYGYVLKAMHKVLNAADRYMYRQYYLRDCAVEALKEGNTEEALDYLKQIGV